MNKSLLALIVGVLFCQCAWSQFNDDRLTVGLWQMNESSYYETATRSWVADIDTLNPGRDNDIALGDTVNTPSSYPTFSVDGESLVFSGGQCAFTYVLGNYGNYDSLKIELWFFRLGNMVTGEDETLLSVGDLPDYSGQPWEMRLRRSSGNRVYFYVHTDQGVYQVQQLYTAGVWNHVVVQIDPYNGQITLDITPDGESTLSAVTAYEGALIQESGRVYMGCRSPGVNSFNGNIAELKMSVLPAVTDGARTVALWHMDYADLFEDSQYWIEDDDTNFPERNNDLALPADPNFLPTMGADGSGQDSVGEALIFDGNDYAYAQDAWEGYDSVNIDFWFYHAGDIASDQTLVTAGNANWPFELRLRRSSGNRLYFYVTDSSGGVHQLNPVISVGVWNHVEASVDSESGLMSMTITPKGGSPATVTKESVGALLDVSGDIWISCTRSPGARPFLGRIDQVEISILGDLCGLWGYSIADLNQDCIVDAGDLKEFASYWLDCSMPEDPACGFVY
ncbi:MAG: LamG-like jellyroll fold domain-containing protein [Sedimentisphaeraceae bacterium JB056]